MVTVVLGCDSNQVNDATCQNTVEKILKDAGYSVEKLGIDPNSFANYSYKSEAKGKVGVYLMAASLISFLDATDGNFDFNVFGIRGDVTSWGTEEGFKTKGVHKDPDGSYSHRYYDECNGMTYPQLNQKFQGKCVAVPGETPEKLGQNIVSALQGASFAGGGNQNNNTGNDSEEEEDWGDRDNFTPHKGKIMEIKPYKEISSISFDKSYDSPTGTGNVEILYSTKDYRFIYKGVAMKLKLRRSCDAEWSATGVEEPNYDENEKFFKEHIPTDELLKELGLPNYRKQSPVGTSNVASYGFDDSLTDDGTGTDIGSDSTGGSSSTGSSSSSGSSGTGKTSGSVGGKVTTNKGKKRLSGNYINTLSQDHARQLASRTSVYDMDTIKRLRRRAIGLFW